MSSPMIFGASIARILKALTMLTLVAAGSHAAQTTAPQPLGVQDVLTMRTFQRLAPIMLSADGKLVAYTVKRPRNAKSVGPIAAAAQNPGFQTGPADIWLTDT